MSASGNTSDVETPDDQLPHHDLEDSIDNLTEKRASTREAALDTVIKQLRAAPRPDVIETRYQTILESIKKSLKKGGQKEQRLSATLLPLLSLTVPSSAEGIYRDAAPTLTEILTNSTTAQDLTEVAHASALSNVLASSDELETIKQMELLQALFASGRTVAGAVRSWTLLATTVSPSYVSSTLVPAHFGELATLLHSDDVDVRVAAGEALAVMVEVERHGSEDFDLQQLSEYTDIDDMLATLDTLVSDKTKGRAKKDKVKQKLPFKDINAYIADAVEPSETLSIMHQKFEFGTWQKLVQLNALRDTLAEGFQAHFESNELVQDILESRVDRMFKKEKLNAQEKRAYMSPSSSLNKERSKDRSRQRWARESEKLF